MANVKPKVIVFDLDYTLWPFWVDYHVEPPFQKTSVGPIVDCHGVHVNVYPEVPHVLSDLHNQGYSLSLASRTGEIQGAHQLINLFGWKKYLAHEQIYPGSKNKHITEIRNAFKVEFEDIIFFDDEGNNIRDVSELGVLSIRVENGVTKKIVDDALKQYSVQKSRLF